MRNRVFEVEQQGNVLVVIPQADLREFEYELLEEGAAPILEKLGSGAVKHLIIDFQFTDYYGSTALSYFVKLWKRVKCGGGKMVLCGVSPHEREILEITHLDGLWPIVEDRERAMAEVAKQVTTN